LVELLLSTLYVYCSVCVEEGGLLISMLGIKTVVGNNWWAHSFVEFLLVFELSLRYTLSFTLYRVFTITYPKQTMFVVYKMLQLFCACSILYM